MADALPARRPRLLLVLAVLCLVAVTVVVVQRRSAETVEELLARRRPAYAALAVRLQAIGGRLRALVGGRSELPASWKAGPGVPPPRLARGVPGSGNAALLPLERLEAPFAERRADEQVASSLEAGLWSCRPASVRDGSPAAGDAEPATAELDLVLMDGLSLRYLAVHAASVGAPGAPATLDVWLVDLGVPEPRVLLHHRERAADVAALERQRLPTDFRTRALLLLDAATDGQLVPLD
jgi:hypothetical protein